MFIHDLKNPKGTTTTIEDHITLVLHSLWILRNTTLHLDFKHSTRLNKTEYLRDKLPANTKALFSIAYFNKLKHGINWRRLWTVYLFEVEITQPACIPYKWRKKIFHVDLCLFRCNTLTSWRKLGRSSTWPSRWMNVGFIPVASTLLTLWALRACYARKNSLNILSQEWLLCFYYGFSSWHEIEIKANTFTPVLPRARPQFWMFFKMLIATVIMLWFVT